MTVSTDYVKGHFYYVPLADLQPDPNQPRKYLDPQALEELTASVQLHGILEPILFRKDKSGILYVVAGERRCAAARKVGIVNIPSIYVEGNHAEIALVENLLRQDLTAIEEAEALDRVMKDYSYKQEDLARMIGKAPSTLSEIMSLNRLPKGIRDECRNDPTISKNILIEIAKSKQERGMIGLYKKYREKMASKESLNKRRTREKSDPGESALIAMSGLRDKIRKLDHTQWTDDYRENLRSALSDLRQIIEQKLIPLAPQTEGEGEIAVPEEDKPSKVLA